MGNILSRIQEIAQKERITIGSLERTIGASKGVLSRAISNGTDIQSKWIGILVENYPQYSTRWLLTGEGTMLRTDGGHAKSVTPSVDVSASSDTVLLRLMDKIDQKDAENKQLQSELLAAREELATLKAKYPEYSTSHPEGLGPSETAPHAPSHPHYPTSEHYYGSSCPPHQENQ